MKLLKILLTTTLILISCGRKAKTIKPQHQNNFRIRLRPGVVKAKNQCDVFASVSGLLQEILVSEDELIFKGELPLMRIKK